MNTEQLRKTMNGIVDENKDHLARWAARLEENPVYALTNSRYVFGLAGMINAAEKVIEWLDYCGQQGMDDESALAEIKADLTNEVLRQTADGISQSTCPTTVLMERAKLAAYADIVRQILR
jgi:hypothetical protein